MNAEKADRCRAADYGQPRTSAPSAGSREHHRGNEDPDRAAATAAGAAERTAAARAERRDRRPDRGCRARLDDTERGETLDAALSPPPNASSTTKSPLTAPRAATPKRSATTTQCAFFSRRSMRKGHTDHVLTNAARTRNQPGGRRRPAGGINRYRSRLRFVGAKDLPEARDPTSICTTAPANISARWMASSSTASQAVRFITSSIRAAGLPAAAMSFRSDRLKRTSPPQASGRR
jgi:hypothetical protein